MRPLIVHPSSQQNLQLNLFNFQYHNQAFQPFILQSSKYYKMMIRRPSYKDFLKQTMHSATKLFNPHKLPSRQRPTLSPYNSKRITYPQNSSKDYDEQNVAQSQGLAQIQTNPVYMRHTQGHTRITPEKKQNIDSSLYYTPRQKNQVSPIKQSKVSEWKTTRKQLPNYNDYQSKTQIRASTSRDKKLLHHQFGKATPTFIDLRLKTSTITAADQYFTQNRDYSVNRRAKVAGFDSIIFKNEIKSKYGISTAVLPINQPNKLGTCVSLHETTQQAENLLAPIQFRKKPTTASGLEKSKEHIDYISKSISISKIRNSFKSQTFRSSFKTQPIKAPFQAHSPIKSFFLKQKMSVGDFMLGKKLGEGRFGSVFMVIHKQTGGIFALKKIPKAVIKQHMMIDQFSLEVKLQASISHPNIVSIYAVFDEKQYVYLLLQYLSGGSLYYQLQKKSKFSEQEAATHTKALCTAVEALHVRGIAHRDIKPQNIMITQGACKLGDFGWATLCNQRRKTYCGTTDYVSPEIVQGKQYGPGVDMWCVGVLAYELITGRPPFYHLSKQETFRKIQEATPSFPNSMSKEAIDFIGNLLKKVPEQRMSSTDALAHPFLAKCA